MRSHRTLRLLATIACLSLLGCGEAEDTNPTDAIASSGDVQSTGRDLMAPRDLSPDASPTEGSWYRPVASTSWQWQLTGTLNSSYDVDVYDIDLFDTPAEVISTLQNDGRRVICYFSAGSFEDWRPDVADFATDTLGAPLDPMWEGEFWLDVRADSVRRVMAGRLDMAAEKGCDGVEPDNVDGYTNVNGLDLTASDQLSFNQWLANEAHLRGLSIGLKNSGGQAAELVDYFDFSVNEQCHEFNECDQLQPFLDQGKPIWNAEYVDPDDEATAMQTATELCSVAKNENIRALILPLNLDDAYRVSCD